MQRKKYRRTHHRAYTRTCPSADAYDGEETGRTEKFMPFTCDDDNTKMIFRHENGACDSASHAPSTTRLTIYQRTLTD